MDAAQIAARDRIVELVRADPLADRYLKKIGPYVSGFRRLPSLNNVVDALGERMLQVLIPLDERVPLRVAESMDEYDQWQMRLGLAKMMLDAEVYLWKNGIVDETRELSLPPHVISPDILPADRMYWTFADALREHVSGKAIDWMLVYRNEPRPGKDYRGGFTFVWPMTTEYPQQKGELELVGHHVGTGERFPEDTSEAAEMLLKMLAFLNSPYVASPGERADRPMRREWTRIGRQGEPPEVRVVQLRAAPVKAAQAHEVQHSGRHPGDSGHWYVKPHFRAQWYPSKQAHEVIWIAQQLRGDPSKPLKRKAYSVSR